MEVCLCKRASKELRFVAYQHAEKDHPSHPFSKKINYHASLDWMSRFMKKHSDLSIRKPKATSAARAFELKIFLSLDQTLGKKARQLKKTRKFIRNNSSSENTENENYDNCLCYNKLYLKSIDD